MAASGRLAGGCWAWLACGEGAPGDVVWAIPGGGEPISSRAAAAIPGMTRLLRLVMNRAYRSGLRKEGYEDVTPRTR